MPYRLTTKVVPILSLAILFSCGSVRVYEDPNEPVFVSNEVKNTIGDSDALVVLSFNIEKAKKIELAVSELKKFETNIPVDFYLLQEMDEDGVQSIAKELRLNYLYIPNVYNKLLKKNIGNAILTKGTFGSHSKLILPNKKWVNGRRRHVTVGEVNLGKKKILVYSVHTETSSMKRRKRVEQWDAILEDARLRSTGYKYVLIGGDFNTLFTKDVERLKQKFNAAGFQCATDTAGSTARAFFGLIKPGEDYIFSSGFKVIRSGKIDDSKASDHYPIYTVLRDSLLE